MKLTVDFKGLDAATKALAERFSERRLNAAAATALTRTARVIGADWEQQLQSRFDRPTRATTNAVLVKRAELTNLQAEVLIRDRASGTPPVEWLAPGEYGGARRMKKFEQALVAQGSMPAGKRAVPGPGVKLDAYGNVPRSTIIQVIAQLGAQFSPGYARVISPSATKRAEKSLATGRKYIAIRQTKGQLAAGIYLRQGGRKLVPIFYFVGGASYRNRTDLKTEARRIAARELGPQVARAISESATRLAQQIASGLR